MREVDVAVIGAGPAGLGAATVAAQAGASVLVLEAGPEVGGLLGLQSQPLGDALDLYAGADGQAYAGALRRSAEEAGVEIVTGAPVWDVADGSPEGMAEGLALSFTRGGAAATLRARRLVVATGSTDGVTAFPGWTLPGVVLSRAAQTMVSRWRVLPGRRVVIVGGGDGAMTVCKDLRDAGAEVVAIIDSDPEPEASRQMVDEAAAAGVRVLSGHAVARAHGASAVERVSITRVGDPQREPIAALGADLGLELDADCVVLATHRLPDFRAAGLLGVRTSFQEGLGGRVPFHNAEHRTSDRRVFVVGDASGIENGAVAMAQGRLAGLHAAADLGSRHPDFDRVSDEAGLTIADRRRDGRGRARALARRRLLSGHRDEGA